MGTLGIYSFQARQQGIRCWISWGRQALSWDNLIITSLSVFFKSFFSEDQASCLVEVDEIQLDMKMKVHDGEVIEVGRDVPLGANPANPALYRNFRLVLKEVIWKSQSHSTKLSTTCICWEFRHQLAPLALVRNLATGCRHMHCHIAWVGISLLASSVSINFVFSSIRVKSARSSSWSSTRVFN